MRPPLIVLPRLLRVASFRFAALYVAMFAVSALVLGVTVLVQSRTALQQQMDDRIKSELAFLSQEYRTGDLARLTDLIGSRGRGATALDYLLQDAHGTHITGEIPAQVKPVPGWSSVDIEQAADDDGRPERVRFLLAEIGDGLVLGVGDDLNQIDVVEGAIGTALTWAIVVATILGIGGGVLLSRAFLNRVDAIGSTAEAIIEGDLSSRIPIRGTDDDLDRLAATLNRMLDRIVALMENLRQISSDVAHDLRTPLSRLYLQLEDARRHPLSAASHGAAIDAAIGEAENLLAIFSALLRISQVGSASARAGFALVDLSALVDAVADAYRPDAEEAGYTLEARIVGGLVGSGDKELLTQALANLVENAMRHTPPGTHIFIELEPGPAPEPNGAHLTVADDGPGVAAADLPRLIQRFYRGERSRTTPGHGLGLSLVNAVADLHRASLTIVPAMPGLRVELSIPGFRPTLPSIEGSVL